jgi:hypothetical protein
MAASADYVLGQAHKLVQHCEHTQALLRTIVELIDHGLYDTVRDEYAVRLPGVLVREIQSLLEPIDKGTSADTDDDQDRSCDT